MNRTQPAYLCYPLVLLLSACPATTQRPAGKTQRSTASPASAPTRTAPASLLIRNAVVWTATGTTPQPNDVLVIDGKISAIGRNLHIAKGGIELDAQGQHLTPGMIDPHSHLGVYPVPSLQAHQDGNEIVKPLSAGIRAEDAFWPQDPGISRALAAGVTTIQVLPGSANLIGGRGAILHTVAARTVQEMRVQGAPPTLKMACGENPKRVYGKRGGPNTRMGNAGRVREIFQQAREYRRKWRRFDKQHKRDKDKQKATPPPRDLALETLAEVLDGRVDVHWHCYRADDMRNMLAIAKEYGFQIRAFHHAVEAYKIRDLLKAANTAVVTWVNWWGFKIEAYDAIPENAPLIQHDGGLVSLHSDSPQVIQRFNQEAALAYAHAQRLGLPINADQALQLVTLNPARVLGIDKQRGSIEVGKSADLVLWDGSPFSVYSRPVRVYIAGALEYQREQRRRQSDFELGQVPQPAPLAAAGDATALRLDLPEDWPTHATSSSKGPRPKALKALVGGAVYGPDGRWLSQATVLIGDDRIVAVSDQPPPAGATIIDAQGMKIVPGLIAADSALGLVDISLEPSARDGQPSGKADPVRSGLRVWETLNPFSATLAINRLAGFTSAVVAPSGGLISGQAAAYDLLDQRAKPADLAAPVALYANLGQAVDGSRALTLWRLRRLLDDARLLKNHRRAIEARRFRDLSAPTDQLTPLIALLERKQILVIRADRASDILAALALAKEQRILVAISGAAEGWRVADQLAAAKVPVLLDPDLNLPASYSSLAGRFDNAARLHQAGVTVAFSSGGEAHNVRSLRQFAGIAAAFGLPKAAALAALTSVPAKIFGLSDRGALQSGRLANIAVYRGDPLELDSTLTMLFIAGEQIPLTSRQTALRDRYRNLPRR